MRFRRKREIATRPQSTSDDWWEKRKQGFVNDESGFPPAQSISECEKCGSTRLNRRYQARTVGADPFSSLYSHPEALVVECLCGHFVGYERVLEPSP